MNIVLVVIDTLRYDHVGANGAAVVRTPHLDALAGRSWVFDRAFAASFPTIPHRTDVMRGRYGRPFHKWMPLRHDAGAFPRALARAGWATQLIHDTPHLVNGGHNFDWPFQAWTMVRGAEVDRPWIDDRPLEYLDNWQADPLFDYVGDPSCPQPGHVLAVYARANRGRKRPEDWNAARVFDTAARFIRDNARRDRFFLWVDCFDPHEPWDAPPEYVRMYDDTPGYDGRLDPRAYLGAPLPDDPDHAAAVAKRRRAMYAGKVTWVDRWFGELTRALDETGRAADTAVIVTSDHGTNLGEHGRWNKAVPVHEQEAHVPLIVHAPGRDAGRCDLIVQPQDITATILALAGVEPEGPIDGRDALAAAEGEASWPRETALTGRAAVDWGKPGTDRPFTVFDRDGYLVWHARADACALYAYGADRPIPGADRVEALHAGGLEEIARRGAPAAIVGWLRAGGRGAFPAAACPDPAPPGYHHYWDNSLTRW